MYGYNRRDTWKFTNHRFLTAKSNGIDIKKKKKEEDNNKFVHHAFTYRSRV